jgi:uncharacterized protein
MISDPYVYAAIAIVFAAAIVRGFSGFGFSLLTISALSLFYPPQAILPPIFMLEILASLSLLPSVWRDIHWKTLLPLILGATAGTPIGVWALSTLPARPMQLALSAFVLIAVILLWRGFALKSTPGKPASFAAGAASGLANGAFGIGGPPAILFYFASPSGAAAGRASLIFYFMYTDVLGLGLLSSMANLVSSDSLLRAALYAPALFAGIWLGQRSFKTTNPEKFRKAVLILLGFLAVLIAIKALAELGSQ